MANISLHSACSNTVTCVSNKFIDIYMPDANGEYVKVYLYLLRCFGSYESTASISTIADLFNHTEKDVERALKYWERVNLLRLEYDVNNEICDICFIDPETTIPTNLNSNHTKPSSSEKKNPPEDSSQTRESSIASPINADVESSNAPVKKEYTLDEVKAFQKDENISELFFIIETYLKHPLSTNDINTILYWYDSLHFSVELIVYLVEYCISKGHSNMRYMDKVALAWSDSNISTVVQAKENVAAHSQAYYAVMKALGISGRNLIDNETAFITKWTKEYVFDIEIIQEACKRTIIAIHQPSFEYTDTILTSWYKNHVHTLKDIEQLDSSFSRNKKMTANVVIPSTKNKFNNFNQREYDSDQLEKMLLTTSVH